MEQWEYHIVNFPIFLKKKYSDEEFITEMNSLGKEGWELCGTSIPTNSFELIAFFKRKI